MEKKIPDSLYTVLMVIDVRNLCPIMCIKINESYLRSVHFIEPAVTEVKQEAAKICKEKKSQNY